MKLFSNKTGAVDLPLHYGYAPRWLFEKMVELARAMIEVITLEFGPVEFVKRTADPLWFQAFGCILGFDWHSSGLTTTVCGAIKEALKSAGYGCGLFACGGKGRTARKTPTEITLIANSGYIKEPTMKKLQYSSKMTAKVDSALVQDGYDLYHHMIIFTSKGEWSVIQQGLNAENRYARRYHWLFDSFKNFVVEPHKAICCDKKNKTFNLVDRSISLTRETVTSISSNKPEKTIREIIKLPSDHAFSPKQIDKLKNVLVKTYENPPKDFEELVGREGVGPKTLRALSMVSHLCYGTPISWKDPVKYSFAHGGKDGVPYPIDRENYSKTIETIRNILSEAKTGLFDKKRAFQRLQKSFEV